MDICLPELAEPTDEPPQTAAQRLLASYWITIHAAPDATCDESERATHELCAALPLLTTDEARLN